MKRKKIFAAVLAASMLVGTMPATAFADGDNVIKIATNFQYATLEPHDSNSAIYDTVYGIAEQLFKIGEGNELLPSLAKDAVADGTTWTITLQDGLVFSNGDPVTPDMVIRNLKRAAEVSESRSEFADYTYTVVDDHTFTIDCGYVNATMKNMLAANAFSIVDLDAVSDFTNEIIATGPFVLDSFDPDGYVTVSKNENYWGGDVNLDGAEFYYMQDDDAKLMAMQNGEVDTYTGVTAAAKEIYEADPATYTLVTIPATRLQFYILNCNRVSENVRKAINLTVDSKAIEEYLDGTVTATVGPFNESTPYGKAEKPEVNPEEAKKLLEEDGYTLNGNGYYEKDGTVLSLNIAYYASRSLDTIATLMQEELKEIGVEAILTCEEDPDATYMSTADFDIALYCSIADTTGDPESFLKGIAGKEGWYTVGGFQNDECDSLLKELESETDPEKRAELGNQIVQLVIDSNAYGFIALFNKTTVLKKGVSGYSEYIPLDFYGIDAQTTLG